MRRRRFLGRCSYCLKILPNLETDHIVPKSRGGGDEPDNLTSACQPCNIQKRARTPLEMLFFSPAPLPKDKRPFAPRQYKENLSREQTIPKSIRLQNNIWDAIDNRAEELGINRNLWLKRVVMRKLHGGEYAEPV